MRLLLLPLLLSLCLLPAACGQGTLAGIWDEFSAEQFPGNDGGGDGEDPGGPGGPGDGGFEPMEVAALDDAQGVTGDVRNVEVVVLGAQTLAFLAAGPDGVHIVDVSNPGGINETSFMGTLNAASLATPPAAIAGGRVDALAVVDNTYLVCVSVGSVDGAGNAVTLFHLPTLQALLLADAADLSTAFVPRSGPDVIAAPGNADGKGGGVSGASNAFFVATGGPAIGVGQITPGVPGTWAVLAPFTPAEPVVESFLDVIVNGTNAYASVESGDQFGIIAVSLLPTPTVTTTTLLQIEGAFGTLDTDPLAGPGNFALDLAIEGEALLVSGDAEFRTFNIANPAVPAPVLPIPSGEDTIGIAAGPETVFIGAGDRVQIFVGAQVGGFQLLAEVTFPAPMVIRGVAPLNALNGRFVLCCAGSRGLRVVQWSETP